MKYLGFNITKEKQKLGERVWNLYTAKDLYSEEGHEVVFKDSEKLLIKVQVEQYWKKQINADRIVPDNILKTLKRKDVI